MFYEEVCQSFVFQTNHSMDIPYGRYTMVLPAIYFTILKVRTMLLRLCIVNIKTSHYNYCSRLSLEVFRHGRFDFNYKIYKDRGIMLSYSGS